MLLQIGVEPFPAGPIYLRIRETTTMERRMQSDAIQQFLVDSRRYLGR
jgi:hypothetical protein